MAEAHDAVEVIVAKRDGAELTDSQIDRVIDAYTRGVVADEQMSALNMAILLNGMNRRTHPLDAMAVGLAAWRLGAGTRSC